MPPALAASFRSARAGLLYCSLLLGLFLQVAPAPGEEAVTVSAERLRNHVAFLASDLLAGRDSGEPGLEVAAEYIAGQFRQYGLEPAGDAGTYFHSFTIPFGAAFGRGGGVTLRFPGGEERKLSSGLDAVAFGYSSEAGSVEAPLVFAGYGLRTGDEEKAQGIVRDDYAGLDVKGKVVVVFRFLPRQGEGFPGGRRSPLAALTAKLRTARELGARGLVLVTPPGGDASPGDRDPAGVAHRASPRQPTLPAVIASVAVADDLFSSAGKDCEGLVRRGDASPEPLGFEIPGALIRFETVPRSITLRNVVARLPGSGPLAHEAVVIGAHYDHIGRFGNQVDSRNLGAIHNGADDNASGTAGVLELARVLATRPPVPGRALVFVAFSGEELGLFGSKAWLDAPRRFRVTETVPCFSGAEGPAAGSFGPGTTLESRGDSRKGRLEVRSLLTGKSGWVEPRGLERISGAEAPHEISAMLNMDMIGHAAPADPVGFYGADNTPEVEALLAEVREKTAIPVERKGKGPAGGGSDHESFLQRGIPSLFLFTGMHKLYNTPGDDTETLSYDAAKRVLDAGQAAVEWLKSSPVRLTLARATAPANPHAQLNLGIALDESFKEGARVASVEQDSPAARAGLAAGDVILAVGDRKVASAAEWDSALEESRDSPEVVLRARRGGEERVVKVPVPRRTGFGVSFGSVPDYGFSGRGVRFQDIKEASPARKAGVQPGDVLVRWGSKDVEDVEQWTALLGQHKPGDEVPIVVERAGARLELRVKLEARG